MKFSLETASDKNYIQSYGHDHIVIKSSQYSESHQFNSDLILSADKILTDHSFSADGKLADSDILLFNKLDTEVIIFVTNETFVSFLSPETRVALTKNNIGVECMPLGPACRTYNLLMTEGREVALVVRF